MPTLDLERGLLAAGATAVVGVDEVGRGALAGPVTVGLVVVDTTTQQAPDDVDDSKMLSRARRESLVAPLTQWCAGWSLGSASAAEIDAIGIVAALRLAFLRGYAQLTVQPSHVILDGRHNWIGGPDLLHPDAPDVQVTTRVKADRECASVAAASVLAKVDRDAHMRALATQHPTFGWDSNVGYGAAVHLAAIRRDGPTEHHRRSWRLPVG